MTSAAPAAIVIGAGGGIGRALVATLADRGDRGVIHALSRRPPTNPCADVRYGTIDVTREETIRSAAATIEGPADLIVVATGLLHEGSYGPERALRDLDAASLTRVFAVNTIGPALVLKHFAPLLARDRRAVFALLSARVGSISDNRSGGWYGYRASKAALNMIVRSASIELTRSRPQAICVGLHPGTVDTALSKPFQANVPSGRLFTAAFAAGQLLNVMRSLTIAETGKCLAWDGAVIEP